MLPTFLSHRHTGYPPFLAIHILAASNRRLDTSSLSSGLPFLAESDYEVCYNPFYSTLSYPVLPRASLSSLAAICEGDIKKAVEINTNVYRILIHTFQGQKVP